MNPRPTALLAAVVGLALVMGFAVDTLMATPPPIVVEPGEGQAAIAGTWYCTAGDTAGGRALSVIAAAPPGDANAQARLDSFSEGAATRGPDVELVPATHAVRSFTPGLADLGTSARWWDAPTAVSRSWVVNTPGAPTGFVEGPCEPEPSPEWHVPGLSTAGGAQAWVVLGNPFDTDASVSIDFLSPNGPVERQLLQNVVVPKRSTRTVLLNEHVPEEVDLGARVTTRSGRIVVEGYQSFDAALGGIDGVSLLKAAPAPATEWTVPWFRLGGEDQSWVWVSNTGDRPASLTLTLLTPDGGALPEGLEEVNVAPGSVQRIDLRGALPEGATRAGVTVTSDNGVPVVVSVATQLRRSDARTGAAVQLGATSADATWIISGGPSAGRRTFIHLANPDPEPAVVDVRVWTEAGPVGGPELRAVTVPAGAVVAVNTGQYTEASPTFSVFVTATSGRVVAGRESFDAAGTFQLVAGVGVPGRSWAGGADVPPVEFDPSLLERLGDPAPAIGEPSPTPTFSPAPDPGAPVDGGDGPADGDPGFDDPGPEDPGPDDPGPDDPGPDAPSDADGPN